MTKLEFMGHIASMERHVEQLRNLASSWKEEEAFDAVAWAGQQIILRLPGGSWAFWSGATYTIPNRVQCQMNNSDFESERDARLTLAEAATRAFSTGWRPE